MRMTSQQDQYYRSKNSGTTINTMSGDGDDLQQQQVDEYTETTMPMNTRTILMKITDRKQN
jgi:hypothetical protein